MLGCQPLWQGVEVGVVGGAAAIAVAMTGPAFIDEGEDDNISEVSSTTTENNLAHAASKSIIQFSTPM